MRNRILSISLLCCAVLLLVSFHNTSAQNGDQIVFASDRDGNLEIYTMNADGSNIQRLTYDEGQDIDPVWSPDRRQIAFVSARSGNFAIFVMNNNGSNLHRITPNDGNYYSSPAWSPDGNQIAFVSDRTGNLDIYAINTNGENIRQLTNAPGDDDEPNWGPDGRIVFSSDRDGFFEIYTMNANGGNVTRLTFDNGADNYSPAWSPDGSEIAFAAVSGSFSEIIIIDANGNDERVLIGVNEHFAGSTTWSPTGDSLAFTLWKPNEKPMIQSVNYNGQNARNLTNEAHESNWPSWSTPASAIALSSSQIQVVITGNELGTARTKPNTQVWTQPDVKRGHVIMPLYPGTELYIIAGPQSGSIRFDSDIEGDWYQVRIPSSSDPLGWIQSELLTIDSILISDESTDLGYAYRSARVDVNAQVWTYPDVKQGHIIMPLYPDTRVLIVDGPVSGSIRYNTDDEGNWYQIQFPTSDEPIGWIWDRRLIFEN